MGGQDNRALAIILDDIKVEGARPAQISRLSRVREALARHRGSVRASLLEGELLAERGDHLRAT